MKWIIYSIILGIAEVWSIGELHGVLGTSKLVGLYVATTALGAVFLYIQLPVFRDAMRAMKNIENTWKKKAKDPDYKPTAEEIQKLKPMVYVGIYFPALVLIAIPGIVSDIIGTLLVFPVLSNRLLEYNMNKAINNASK
jgi:UPF0716 family protein affecting phage T7 exclusion